MGRSKHSGDKRQPEDPSTWIYGRHGDNPPKGYERYGRISKTHKDGTVTTSPVFRPKREKK